MLETACEISLLNGNDFMLAVLYPEHQILFR